MKRLTDRKTAAALKHNAEGLRAKGFDIPINDQRYIKLAEYENAEEEREQKQKSEKCKCWHEGNWFLKGYDTCWGTREQEPCTCKGDRSKCDFYEHVRKENEANTCVCCGAIIPEGRQICPKCEKEDGR